ncbi:MAG: hypothetical protein QGI60_05965 [archaeon]|jgi:hypothetical protein|nr:hypothetical protein [archaeon]
MLIKRGQPPGGGAANRPGSWKGVPHGKKTAILIAAAKREQAVLKQADSLITKFNKRGGGGSLHITVGERVGRIKYLLKNEQLMGKGALRSKWVKNLSEALDAFLVQSNAYWDAALRFAADKEKVSPEVIQQLEAKKKLEQIGMTQVCAKFIGP